MELGNQRSYGTFVNMRFTAFLLLACLITITSVGVTAKPVQENVMKCCKSKSSCHRLPEKGKAGSGCDGNGCAAMFSCDLCGYVLKERIVLQTPIAYHLEKPVAHYIGNELIGYHADNWKPPKSC